MLADKFQLAQVLLTDSTFHRETLDRLGLLKPTSLYQETPFIAENPKSNQANLMKVMGAEFFSLLRSGLDVRVEFDNSEDLRRYRDSYILHILDYVMQDRERVHFNDIKRFDEYNKDKVTLDNVFELANNQNKESEDEDDEEEENSDIDTPEEEEEVKGKKKKKIPKPLSYIDIPSDCYLSSAKRDFFQNLSTQD